MLNNFYLFIVYLFNYLFISRHGVIFTKCLFICRYDLIKNKWDKITEIQEARKGACGAAAYGKVFIAGGTDRLSRNCEVYDEITNEWQFIASVNMELSFPYKGRMICVDYSLYVIGGCLDNENRAIERYDPDRNEWIEKTVLPIEEMHFEESGAHIMACSVRVFKGSSICRRGRTHTKGRLFRHLRRQRRLRSLSHLNGK